MISLKQLFLIAALLLPALSSAGPQRVWQYTDGRKITAEYQWSSPHLLYLRDKNGKEFQVQLGALSNADLEYVRGMLSKDRSQGIVYHVPLTWEEYRSKKITSSRALEVGYYPVDSLPASEGTLRIQFRRFGPVPKLADDQQVILRLSTARHGGTRSRIRINYQGKTIGVADGAPHNGHVDISLPATVLQGSEKIVFDVTCGSDTVLIRTGKSGAGPRLLIVKKDQDPE